MTHTKKIGGGAIAVALVLALAACWLLWGGAGRLFKESMPEEQAASSAPAEKGSGRIEYPKPAPAEDEAEAADQTDEDDGIFMELPAASIEASSTR